MNTTHNLSMRELTQHEINCIAGARSSFEIQEYGNALLKHWDSLIALGQDPLSMLEDAANDLTIQREKEKNEQIERDKNNSCYCRPWWWW